MGLIDLGWRGPVVDALVLDRRADKYRSGNRKLDTVCDLYGVVNAAAHDAAGDAVASAQVLRAICAKYPKLVSYDLNELTAFEAEWHREWADGMDAFLKGKGKAGLDEGDFFWPIAGESMFNA
jgi:DNA polymerase-3 subunit epsilon